MGGAEGVGRLRKEREVLLSNSEKDIPPGLGRRTEASGSPEQREGRTTPGRNGCMMCPQTETGGMVCPAWPRSPVAPWRTEVEAAERTQS